MDAERLGGMKQRRALTLSNRGFGCEGWVGLSAGEGGREAGLVRISLPTIQAFILTTHAMAVACRYGE